MLVYSSSRLRVALLVLLAASLPPALSAASAWRPVDAPGGLERATALALDDGRLAAGGERGVAQGPREGPLLGRVSLRGAVRELARARGALWVASETGLWRIGPGGARAEVLAPGELARSVRDVAAAAGWLVAATDAGVFASERSGAWQRLPALPLGPASRVEALEVDGGVEVWAAIEGALWRRDARGAAERVVTAGAASGEEGVVDLALDPAQRLLVLRARSLSRREAGGVWRSERLVLPPGAAPQRLVAAAGRLWLATDAGLVGADGLAGPWRRASAPVGHSPVLALAGDARGLAVATSRGLFLGPGRGDAAAAPVAGRVAGDPPVQAVHRAALRHLELEPRRMHHLMRAVGWSAWLPELRLGASYDEGEGGSLDYDQAFISGDKRFLTDRDVDHFTDYGASIALEWDLGALVFDADRIDVSREARLVAQLRDDVLDEITQLYFERQRVLAALADPPPDASPAALRLRAAELAAGIDAWTGGWFSAQLAGGRHRSAPTR